MDFVTGLFIFLLILSFIFGVFAHRILGPCFSSDYSQQCESPASEIIRCTYCQETRVLFFPDKAMPCFSLINGLKNQKIIRCYRKGDCIYSHDKTSMMEILITLNKATKSIDICMYLITNQTLAEFLKFLNNDRNIQVRLITDSGGDDDKKIRNQGPDLQKAGIVVKTNQSTGALMHNKFVIIDNRIVILGSFNWTRKAVLENDEAIIITPQENVVAPFVAKFKRMWKMSSVIDYESMDTQA